MAGEKNSTMLLNIKRDTSQWQKSSLESGIVDHIAAMTVKPVGARGKSDRARLGHSILQVHLASKLWSSQKKMNIIREKKLEADLLL